MRFPEPSADARNKPVGHCPATGKAQFHSRSAAKTTARRHDRTQHPYPCDCGYWHLGHMTGHDREWHRQAHGRE